MSGSAKVFALRWLFVARRLQPSGRHLVIALIVFSPACLHRSAADPNVIVVGVASGPNNLDVARSAPARGGLD